MSTTLSNEEVGAIPPPLRKATSLRELPKRWKTGLIVGDVAMFLLASLAAVAFVRYAWRASLELPHVWISTAIFISFWLAIFDILGLYRRSFTMTMRDELYYTSAALTMGVAPQFLLFTLVPAISTSRAQLLASLGFSIVAVGLFRVVFHGIYEASMSNRRGVVIVGRADRLAGAIETFRKAGNSYVYWLSVPDIDATLAHAARLGPRAFADLVWFQQALQYGARRIIFTEIPDPAVVPQLLVVAAAHGVSLAFAPPRFRAHAFELGIETIGNQALMVPRLLPACKLTNRIIKRAFDITVASLALLIVSPLMVVISLLLALDRSGPILYRQQRVGLNGTVFDILKFRSMRVDAESDGAKFATHGDARVTRLGRFMRRTSIDELPQFLNVLRGDMSVVGPRPERPIWIEGFRGKLARYDDRHLVKPGITAWSHVHMKRNQSADDVAEKLDHDLFYVENWSPFMDLYVVFKTAAEVLFHRAA